MFSELLILDGCCEPSAVDTSYRVRNHSIAVQFHLSRKEEEAMELRQTEEKIHELIFVYERTRTTPLTHPDLSGKIASLPAIGEHVPSALSPTSLSVEDVLFQLQTLQSSIQDLQSKMDRFRERLVQTDPVTGNPRYGANAAARVTTLLSQYDQLVSAMDVLQESSVVQELEQTVAEIESEKSRQMQDEQERQRQAAESLRKEQEEQQRKLQQEQEDEENTRRQELLELNRRAEESRRARLEAEEARLAEERRVREERQRKDREWMDGIQKGPEGVQQELAELLRATQDDAAARTTAITALHTLFSQIVSHPEEVNFRRVRRDHPKFNADIGRHDGGKEILIAAGFRLGAIDDIPCFISTEPNVENDLDGWSEWFDLLKSTLDIIEQELLK